MSNAPESEHEFDDWHPALFIPVDKVAADRARAAGEAYAGEFFLTVVRVCLGLHDPICVKQDVVMFGPLKSETGPPWECPACGYLYPPQLVEHSVSNTPTCVRCVQLKPRIRAYRYNE